MAKEHQAIVRGIDLPVSIKDTVEIGNFIRGKSTKKAKDMLEKVANEKLAVPIRRYDFDRGHKPGIGPGRYPVKASTEIIKLIKSAEANAQNQGLSVEKLFIKEFVSNKGPTQWHYGRKRRRQAKRTHINIVVAEMEIKKEKAKIKQKKTEKVEE